MVGKRRILYESGSLLIISNHPFSDWDCVFPDSVMTVAAIDRLVHHAQILALDGDSYRKTQSLARLKETPLHPSPEPDKGIDPLRALRDLRGFAPSAWSCPFSRGELALDLRNLGFQPFHLLRQDNVLVPAHDDLVETMREGS